MNENDNYEVPENMKIFLKSFENDAYEDDDDSNIEVLDDFTSSDDDTEVVAPIEINEDVDQDFNDIFEDM